MIDYFPEIYTAAAKAVRQAFPGVLVTGEITDDVPRFPCVQIEESLNVPTQQDNGPVPGYALINLRVRAYSNTAGGRVTQARALIACIDQVFEPLNLRRVSYVPMNGLYNNSAYRIEATYSAAIDESGVLYRR